MESEENTTVQFKCVAQTLRKAARLVTRRYEEGLRSVNLTASQFSILQALAFRKTLPFKTISSTLGMEQTTLSRLLKTLEKRDLISISVSENDSRSRVISATPQGTAVFEDAQQIWQRINDDSLSRLNESDWQVAKAALTALSK